MSLIIFDLLDGCHAVFVRFCALFATFWRGRLQRFFGGLDDFSDVFFHERRLWTVSSIVRFGGTITGKAGRVSLWDLRFVLLGLAMARELGGLTRRVEWEVWTAGPARVGTRLAGLRSGVRFALEGEWKEEKWAQIHWAPGPDRTLPEQAPSASKAFS